MIGRNREVLWTVAAFLAVGAACALAAWLAVGAEAAACVGCATAALLGAMDKRALFPAIAAGGVLPRKTFSMGEATEKRYYMECRRIDAKNP